MEIRNKGNINGEPALALVVALTSLHNVCGVQQNSHSGIKIEVVSF